MNLVKFSSSGTISTISRYNGSILSNTNLVILNEEIMSVLYSGVSSSGIFDFNFEDMHTSKDSYIVAPASFGYLGQSVPMSDFSPTEECLFEDFQNSKYLVSGTELLYKDFEDISLDGISATFTGTGVISISGIYNSSDIEGDYYFALNGTNTNNAVITSTDTTTTGISCGRIGVLGMNGISTSTETQTVGVAFLKQGPSITDNAYKLMLVPQTDGTYTLSFCVGQLGSTSGGFNTGTEIWSESIDFGGYFFRNNLRNIWLMVDWEVVSKGLLMNVYIAPYTDGDTVGSLKEKAVLIRQDVYTGYLTGSDLYTTSSYGVSWFICQNESTTLGVDMLLLESLTELPKVGLHRFEILERNIDTASGSTRPYITNILQNPGVPPVMSVIETSRNNLISSNRSLYGKYGYGYSGIYNKYLSWQTASDSSIAIFTTENDIKTSGILHGVCRIAGFLDTMSTVSSKIGFSFLRQGTAVNDNCYTAVIYNSSSNLYVQIRKGTVYDSSFGDTSDFNGTVVATSSSINSNMNLPFWIEIRWKVGTSSVTVEVLYTELSKVVRNIDSSPGNIDYKLSSVLTYTDSSSPYLTSSTFPLVSIRGNYYSPFIHQVEIRKQK